MEWEIFPPQPITVQPAQRCHGRHNQKVTGQKTDQRGQNLICNVYHMLVHKNTLKMSAITI